MCGGRSWAGPERGSESLCVLTHGMGSTPHHHHDDDNDDDYYGDDYDDDDNNDADYDYDSDDNDDDKENEERRMQPARGRFARFDLDRQIASNFPAHWKVSPAPVFGPASHWNPQSGWHYSY